MTPIARLVMAIGLEQTTVNTCMNDGGLKNYPCAKGEMSMPNLRPKKLYRRLRALEDRWSRAGYEKAVQKHGWITFSPDSKEGKAVFRSIRTYIEAMAVSAGLFFLLIFTFPMISPICTFLFFCYWLEKRWLEFKMSYGYPYPEPGDVRGFPRMLIKATALTIVFSYLQFSAFPL